MNWYEIENIEKIDTPALLVYPDRIKQNIMQAISMVGEKPARLRPHIKTHKSKEAAQMMIDAGIRSFKCATISEAELLGLLKAPDVLLAYQPVGPKIKRLIQLIQAYPDTLYSCVVDNLRSAADLSRWALEYQVKLHVFIDLDLGMHRTGIAPHQAMPLIQYILAQSSLHLRGLHAYDGHIRDQDITARKENSDLAFNQVEQLKVAVSKELKIPMEIICGGSPTFPIHARRASVQCSPGTFIYWDQGYSDLYQGQTFLPAAVVITRIISKTKDDYITLDLGHKSIAAENDIHHRVHFLNTPPLKPIGQSEEHLVLSTSKADTFSVGDVLYGIPHHICPTVALYDQVLVVEGNKVIGVWKNIARDRSLTI